MYRLILIIISILSFNSLLNAQDLVKLNNMTIVNDALDNVSVQIALTGQQQNFLDRINQSGVNAKAGFNAELSVNNTLLTLNFAKPFTESELETLLEYCGFKLDLGNFNQLKQLLNQ